MGDQVADQVLVSRVQSGDRTAFDLLVLRYQHRIVKLVGRYVREPADALDVAQDAFIKAYRALPGFRGDSAFYTWMYRIAINTAKNHLASQARRASDAAVSIEDAQLYDSNAALMDNATPERMAMRDEIQAAVADALEQLPEDLRMAITLRELEGMSYEDISATMDCPIGTVRSRIFRARDAINQRVESLLVRD